MSFRTSFFTQFLSVGSTFKDPVPGYADSILGILGFAVGTGLGIIRVSRASNNTHLDCVPADTVVNLLLLIVWHVSTAEVRNKNNIYTCGLGDSHKIPNREKLKYLFL